MDPTVTTSGVETTAPQTPQAADTTAQPTTFGEAMGQATEVRASEPNTEPSVDDSSAKTDTRDFRGYSRKLESDNKTLRQQWRDAQAELDRLRATQPTSALSQSNPQADQTIAGDDDQALQLLRSVVGETIQQQLEPILGNIREQQEERIWSDFEKLPLVKEMQPEIVTELGKLDSKMPLDQRLNLARANAIANNLDTILNVNREVASEQAREDAYANQGLKRAQTGAQPRPTAAAQPADDLLLRVMDGSIGAREYAERKSEIDQLIREHTFQNGRPA